MVAISAGCALSAGETPDTVADAGADELALPRGCDLIAVVAADASSRGAEDAVGERGGAVGGAGGFICTEGEARYAGLAGADGRACLAVGDVANSLGAGFAI